MVTEGPQRGGTGFVFFACKIYQPSKSYDATPLENLSCRLSQSYTALLTDQEHCPASTRPNDLSSLLSLQGFGTSRLISALI